MADCFVFAGPTVTSLLREHAGLLAKVQLMPPAQRGTMDNMLRSYSPGVVALVDGYFHQVPAVGHQEIRRLLAAGWEVWGLSSIGAIRAFELREYGMKGYGVVFGWLCNHPEFRDDEVTLLHLPVMPFTAVTEPLIHIRFGLKELVRGACLNAAAEFEILKKLEDVWYGYRTLDAVVSMLRPHFEADPRTLQSWIGDFDRYRVKTIDLRQFLEEEPWRENRKA